MSEDNDIKKKDLTVGGVSGSKKMRLGRVHKKKTEDAPEAAAPAVEAKVAPFWNCNVRWTRIST